MKNTFFDRYKYPLSILLCILGFAVVTLVYFSPVVKGKRIKQHDIEMFKGMSKEIEDYREVTGEQTLWTNSMFGGMPAWNIAVKSNSNLIQPLNQFLKAGFPQSIGAVFISMLGFFILLLVLDCKGWVSFIGGLAYGLTSYLFIIIGAGHNSKAMAMAYMAPVIAGILLTYKGKYLWGSILTAIAVALEVRANHLQITYYLLIIVICIVLGMLIKSIVETQFGRFVKASACLIVAAALGILTNGTMLYANYAYSKDTTRGKPVLTKPQSEETNQSKGLDRDYITQWSYGKGETWSLLIPNVKGGASGVIGENNPMNKAKGNYKVAVANCNAYWGDQPGTSGPVYVGAIIVFLFVLSGCILFSIKDLGDKIVMWILIATITVFLVLHMIGILLPNMDTVQLLLVFMFSALLIYLLYRGVRKNPLWAGLWFATILSIMLAWGKNFMGFTDFFIDHVPGYNKFRAVSMTLVIAEVCIPLIGLLALAEITKSPEYFKNNLKKFWIALGITGGTCLLFWLEPTAFFSFKGQADPYYSNQIINAFKNYGVNLDAKTLEESLKTVRIAIFRKDAIRSLLYIVLAAIPLFLYGKGKLKDIYLFPILAILVLFDLYQIDRRYLNNDNFVSQRQTDKPFTASAADQYILKDKSLDFRVVNLTKDVFNDASTSYFHKSIGGYHGAKLRRYQDLITYYLNPEIRQFGAIFKAVDSDTTLMLAMRQQRMLNMLNTKYIIYDPNATPIENPCAFGNAWIVDNIRWVDTPDEEFEALSNTGLRHTAVLHKEFQPLVGAFSEGDSRTGMIALTDYQPNKLTYSFQADQDQLVVFSEIWSDTGWKLYIDGQEHPLLRANYLLRSALIPSGEHQIVMEYAPKAWKVGNTIQFASSLILILGLIGAIVISFLKKEKAE